MIDAIKARVMLGVLAISMAVGITGIIVGIMPDNNDTIETASVTQTDIETVIEIPELYTSTMDIQDEMPVQDDSYVIAEVGNPVSVSEAEEEDAKRAASTAKTSEKAAADEISVEDLITEPEDILPEPTNSPIPTATPTLEPTATPTPTQEPEPEATATPTAEPTSTPIPETAVAASGDIVKSATNEQLLTCIIVTEAGEDSYEEMIATASVIINRMNRNGASMYDVITQPGQFGVYSNGSLAKALKAYISGERSYSSAHAAAVEVLNNGPSYSWTSFNAYSSYMESSQPDGEKLGNSWFYNYH